ncbi:hypothetical protein [Tunturiibacter gelidiferens]
MTRRAGGPGVWPELRVLLLTPPLQWPLGLLRPEQLVPLRLPG